VVGVVVGEVGATEAVRPLVRALARRADVRALDRAPAPDAVLAVGAAAVERTPEGVPVAVVDDGVVRVDGVEIALPGGGVDTAAWPPIAPHVRRRWRRRLGLAADLVVDVATLAAEDRPTALAVAASAVVGVDDLPLALALGCPTVTAAAAAATVGAVDGVHVVLGGRAEAVALAADEHRSGPLSRRGHELARERLDPAPAAAALLQAWGLGPTGPVARLDERLAELGTAPAAPVRRRVADALAPLTPTGGP
jgi:hypothetical protein